MPNKIGDFADELDVDIEHNPVVQGAANTVQQAGATVVKQTAGQINPNKDFIAQLYGTSEKPDQDKPKPQEQNVNLPQQTAEQGKTEEEKKKLAEKAHVEKYYKPFVEDALKKQNEQRKQEEQQKLQEEEQLKQQKAQEKEEQNQEFVMPQGKGRMRMGKPVKSMEVELAKKRTEVHRGTVG